MRRKQTPLPDPEETPVPVHINYRWSSADGTQCSSSATVVARDRRSIRDTVHAHLRDQNLQPDVLIYAYE